jgi:hypothetical protein
MNFAGSCLHKQSDDPFLVCGIPVMRLIERSLKIIWISREHCVIKDEKEKRERGGSEKFLHTQTKRLVEPQARREKKRSSERYRWGIIFPLPFPQWICIS